MLLNQFPGRGLTLPKLVFKLSRYWHEMYSVILFVSSNSLLSFLAEVEHCQNWFSNIPANGMRCILLYYLFPQDVYSVCWWKFNIAKISFQILPLMARDIFCYIICFLMQFIQFASGGLVLPKLVFKYSR